MATRARFSKSDAIISLLALASVVIVFIIVAMPRSHDDRRVKRVAYAQEPYRSYPSGAMEKCVKLWFRPPPDFPEEEIVAFCDTLLLKIYDYIKERKDLIPPLMEAPGKAGKLEDKTEEARDKIEEARIFQTLLVMTDWSSK